MPRKRLIRAFSCDECGTLLVWAGASWCCPRAFHSKALTPQAMRDRIQEAGAGYKRLNSARMHVYYRRVSIWRSILEARPKKIPG